MTLAHRVLAKFHQTSGDSGWDPPDDPDPEPDPSQTWDELVSVFPRPLQAILENPKSSEHHLHNGDSKKLSIELDIEDGGINLSVETTKIVDADEDGPYGYELEVIEYDLGVEPHVWSYSSKSSSLRDRSKDTQKAKDKLVHDLREFSKALREASPEAAARYL
jgi:hypothetical protein